MVLGEELGGLRRDMGRPFAVGPAHSPFLCPASL
jgi:hypothetical protein